MDTRNLTSRFNLRSAILWVLASGLVISTAVPAALADDWPQWRGANRNGVSAETGLLKDWPSQGPRLLWTAEHLGEGYATVSVVGDRLYTAGQKADTSYLLALNTADGKPVWTARFGKPSDPGGFAGPRGTPTVDGDLLFALDQAGELVCLETATGKELWRKNLTKDFGGEQPGWGYTESPLVDGGKVMVTPGGRKGAVVALNKRTGELAWQSTALTDSAHYSSMIIAQIGGIRQYIQLTSVSVAGVAATDGKLLWRAPRRGQTAVIPTPIFGDGQVYVTSGYGVGCNLFKINGSGGQFAAEPVYANKTMVNHHGGVILFRGDLYGYSDGKGWTCQDFKTGEPKWEVKDKLSKGCLAYADSRFYLRQEDGPGTVALIEASPEGYKEHGRFAQPHRSDKNSWPHPVVANGRLYLRDQNVLLCYDVKAN